MLARALPHSTGVKTPGQCPLAQAEQDLLVAEGFGLQVLLHQRVVGVGHRLHEQGAQPLGLVEEVGGDVLFGAVARKVDSVQTGLHRHQVDDPPEILLRPDGHGNHHRPGGEGFGHVVHGLEEIGPLPVHLVDEGDAGHLELVGPLPDLLGLGLDPRDGGNDEYRTSEDPKTVAGVVEKVGVAGGIDDVQAVPLPLAVVKAGADGDPALDFLRLEVHIGSAVIHPPEAVGHAGVEEDGFGQGGLAGPPVGHNSQVTQH